MRKSSAVVMTVVVLKDTLRVAGGEWRAWACWLEQEALRPHDAAVDRFEM